jgi:hypothetical protein
MLILPFIHNVKSNANLNVHTIKFLTIAGQSMWEEMDGLRINKDILNPNDIYRKSKTIKFDNKLRVCEVNTDKTNISEFYKWEEITLNDNETFCWKTYYYFTGLDNVCWLNIPETEKIGDYKVKDLIQRIILKK